MSGSMVMNTQNTKRLEIEIVSYFLNLISIKMNEAKSEKYKDKKTRDNGQWTRNDGRKLYEWLFDHHVKCH